jgi:hypothetical protein
MRISIASESKQLSTYLGGYESLTLVNYYSNLQTEYDKFSNDLNKVDVFAIIEHADISGNLTAVSKLIQSGSGYLLSAKEILVILNGSSERTQNRADKVTAFTDILEEKGFNLRVITPTVLDFPSIYNAFIKNTVVKESTIKVYTKYKVAQTDNGIILKPKKTKEKFSPDVQTGNRDSLKKVDKDTADMLGNALLDIEDREDLIERSTDNIMEFPNIAAAAQKVVFVTGVTDAGKTHSMLMFADELSKNQITSLIIDSTGKDDMANIADGNNFQTTVMRGSELFNTKEQSSLGVHLFSKAYSSTFIHQLAHLFKNKALIFCEVGLEQLSAFVSSWDSDTDIVVVVKFDVTSLLELKDKLVPNLPYKVFVNNDKDEVTAEETGLLQNFLGSSIQVYNYASRIDLFNSLGGAP